MRKLALLVAFFLSISGYLIAQTGTISGKVVDEQGHPIPLASVLIKGTNLGTSTNDEGEFKITARSNQTLVISASGFATKEVLASNAGVVVLISSLFAEDEVVVVGYSTSTKEAFTGSVKQLSGEDLNNKSFSNISQALAGEVAGVRVINTSGQPGTSATIRIRGFGSINGNRDPLYVVDGVPFSGTLNGINQADIASVTVLKDAVATAIYGSRGANGVIVITTISGKGKKSFIEVNGKYGVNMSLIPRYDIIRSPEEYIELAYESIYNQGRSTNAVGGPGKYANDRLFGASGIGPQYNMWNAATAADLIDSSTRKLRPGVTRKYDPERWEDYAFQNSNRSEVDVKFGGSEGKTNYFASLGYLNDVGYSLNSDFKRLSGRLNLNHQVKKWLSTGFNVNYSNSITNNNGQESNSNSVFWFVDNIPSIYPLFLRDASGKIMADSIFGGNTYDYGAGSRQRGFGGLTNAIADATFNTLRRTRNNITGNASINFQITEHLSLDNRLGMQYWTDLGVTRNNKFYGSSAGQKGSLFQTRYEMMNLNLLNMLRYMRKFDVHSLEVLAAHEATKYRYNIFSAGGTYLIDNYGLDLDNTVVKVPGAVGSSTDNNRLESYFAQANYNYDSKYFLSGTIRRDGSSRFVKGEPWGTFGSVGLAWVVTSEDFMRQMGIIKYLKLKTSYGILGDQSGLGYYPGYDRINISNLNGLPSFAAPIPGNPTLTWESAKMFQAGAEFKLGRFLTGSVDYFVKNTTNMIFNRSVGISNGYASITVNDGRLKNSGIEFELTGHIIQKADWFLNIGVNGEHFNNKFMKMPYDPSTDKDKLLDIQGSYGYALGKSIYDWYLREYLGVNPTTGQSKYRVYYEDKNSNDQFDVGEQVVSLTQYLNDNPDKASALKQGETSVFAQATQHFVGKSAIAKLRGGINVEGGYKGFALSIQLLYGLGGWAYDNAYAVLMGSGAAGGNNWHKDIFARWQNPGDITNVPRLSNNADANTLGASTRYLTKANFMALNNINLAYTLPTSLTNKVRIDQTTVFVAGDNLWLTTKRKGFNPATAETGNSDMYRYSPLSTITVGLKVKF